MTNPKKRDEGPYFPIPNVDVSAKSAQLTERYKHLTGSAADSGTFTATPPAGSMAPADTHKSKPATSLSEFLDDDPIGLEVALLRDIMKWDEDVREVTAKRIRFAKLYHQFYNNSDRWWADNMTTRMIHARAEEMVAAVPPTWRPGFFSVGNPDCTTCAGRNQIEYTKDGVVYIKPCECARKALRLDTSKRLVQEYNAQKVWEAASLSERRKLYKKLSKFFM